MPLNTDEFVAASEVERKQWSRVFEMSEALIARVIFDWSKPMQLRAEKRDDGTYDLIAREIDRHRVATTEPDPKEGP